MPAPVCNHQPDLSYPGGACPDIDANSGLFTLVPSFRTALATGTIIPQVECRSAEGEERVLLFLDGPLFLIHEPAIEAAVTFASC